ncbi:unnamed protein product [marine sediment metagenome]|uniref:Uncharacterized protein n=1 Tax=marine sediment metagenome TaxID=412755 RepID=X1N0Q7_9ZZZZ
MSEIKFNVDEGRLIPFDLRINELRDFDKIRYPRTGFYWIIAVLADQESCRGHVDNPYPESIVNTGLRDLIYRIYVAAGETVGLYVRFHDGSAEEGRSPLCLKVGGANPHQCLTLYDGREEPFPAASYTQAKIEYTHASYVTEVTTFIQEVVLGKLS